MGKTFYGGVTRKGREFLMKGGQICQYYLKNDKKLNKKKISTESKEQH